MATVTMSIRVQPTTKHTLERLAEAARATIGGSHATASSVGSYLLDRAALAHEGPPAPEPHRDLPPPLPAVLAPRQAAPVPSDVDRLRAAMGGLTPNAVDDAAGLSRGTCGKALRGTPLAKAGRGGLLRWVVAVEAQR